MLINISNHPSTKWSDEQRAAGEAISKTGIIKDIQFPNVPPDADVHALATLAMKQALDIVDQLNPRMDAVLVQGEMGFTVALLGYIRDLAPGVPCYHATTERVVEEGPDGVKVSKFKFCQFRKYII